MQQKLNTFSRKNRLVNKADFQKAFRSQKVRLGFGKISFVSNNNLAARLGISVRKSTGLISVQRNKIKRIAREAFRHNKSELRGLDLVIFIERKTNELALQQEIKHGFIAIKKNCLPSGNSGN